MKPPVELNTEERTARALERIADALEKSNVALADIAHGVHDEEDGDTLRDAVERLREQLRRHTHDTLTP